LTEVEADDHRRFGVEPFDEPGHLLVERQVREVLAAAEARVQVVEEEPVLLRSPMLKLGDSGNTWPVAWRMSSSPIVHERRASRNSPRRVGASVPDVSVETGAGPRGGAMAAGADAGGASSASLARAAAAFGPPAEATCSYSALATAVFPSFSWH